MIGLVDRGVGNVNAFANAFVRLGVRCKIVRESSAFVGIDKFVLPGVGSFDNYVRALRKDGFADALVEVIKKEDIPILGICVGMQALLETSEEGEEAGLGLIEGRVRRLPNSCPVRPHLGWSEVSWKSRFLDAEQKSEFYFLHSFYCDVDLQVVSGTSNLDFEFPVAIGMRNIFGVQFHPEKSHKSGSFLLNAFGNWECEQD